MGNPVEWDYVLRIQPEKAHTHVYLYRWQRASSTRFAWMQTTIPRGFERPTEDQVLQELYTALIELISMVE